MAGTPEIANLSDALILPTGLSLDDLQPAVLLARELMQHRISSPHIKPGTHSQWAIAQLQGTQRSRESSALVSQVQSATWKSRVFPSGSRSAAWR
jgi:hypothetical protein